MDYKCSLESRTLQFVVGMTTKSPCTLQTLTDPCIQGAILDSTWRKDEKHMVLDLQEFAVYCDRIILYQNEHGSKNKCLGL